MSRANIGSRLAPNVQSTSFHKKHPIFVAVINTIGVLTILFSIGFNLFLGNDFRSIVTAVKPLGECDSEIKLVVDKLPADGWIYYDDVLVLDSVLTMYTAANVSHALSRYVVRASLITEGESTKTDSNKTIATLANVGDALGKQNTVFPIVHWAVGVNELIDQVDNDYLRSAGPLGKVPAEVRDRVVTEVEGKVTLLQKIIYLDTVVAIIMAVALAYVIGIAVNVVLTILLRVFRRKSKTLSTTSADTTPGVKEDEDAQFGQLCK